MTIKRFLRPLARLFLLDLFRDKQARPTFLYALFIIIFGSWFFHQAEGWGWLDSVYFSVITLTTIGYGDFAPHTPIGKVMAIFFGLNGIVILLTLFDHIRRIRESSRSPRVFRKIRQEVDEIIDKRDEESESSSV